MLKKRERLSRREFEKVFASGRRFSSAHLMVIAAPASQGGRCAVSVGKKIAKRAVSRNMVRRNVYRVLADTRSMWSHTDVIVLPRPSIVALDHTTLDRELRETLQTITTKYA